MGLNTAWDSTLAFRDFRDKTQELSRVYWTQQLSADSLLVQLNDKNPDDISAQVIPSSFNYTMHSQKVKDTIQWIPTYMSRNRLHLLVLYTSFLETYLKQITLYYTLSKGYIKNLEDISNPLKLNSVGEAISAPILRTSTVPEMIKYAAAYYDIDFGIKAKEWVKIYKVRCAAAHNGGIATPNFLQAISGQPLALRPNEYDNLGLTWDELRTAMKYGDDIAAMIDSKVSSYDILILETEEVLRELKAKNRLPKHTKLWELLHDDYRLSKIKRKQKTDFTFKFYGIM